MVFGKRQIGSLQEVLGHAGLQRHGGVLRCHEDFLPRFEAARPGAERHGDGFGVDLELLAGHRAERLVRRAERRLSEAVAIALLMLPRSDVAEVTVRPFEDRVEAIESRDVYVLTVVQLNARPRGGYLDLAAAVRAVHGAALHVGQAEQVVGQRRCLPVQEVRLRVSLVRSAVGSVAAFVQRPPKAHSP